MESLIRAGARSPLSCLSLKPIPPYIEKGRPRHYDAKIGAKILECWSNHPLFFLLDLRFFPE